MLARAVAACRRGGGVKAAAYPKIIPAITFIDPQFAAFCTFIGMKRTLFVALLTCLLSLASFAQSNPAPQASPQSGTTQAAPAAQPKVPRCDTAEYRQFDFWIGDWEVVGAKGGKSSSRIENILAGCVILENYSAQGYEGKSFNIYDRASKKWHQTWVDVGGALIEFDGGLKDGKMVLEGEQTTPQGKVWNRMEYTPNPDGTVRQFWTVSTDGGKTWTTAFDGIYYRKKTS
jgi:hypothetical protein